MSRTKTRKATQEELGTWEPDPQATIQRMLDDHLMSTWADPEDFREQADRTDLGITEVREKEAHEFTCCGCWLYKPANQASPTEPGTCRDCTGENDQPEAYTTPPSTGAYL